MYVDDLDISNSPPVRPQVVQLISQESPIQFGVISGALKCQPLHQKDLDQVK